MCRKDFLFLRIYLCRFLPMFLTGFTSLKVLLLFLLSITFFIFVHGFDSISSNIDGVLLINPSAKVFVFGDVHHKDWLTYYGGIDRPRDPRLWFLQSCSFGFLSFFWCKYSFYNGFPSIGKFWLCCLSFHWLSIIFTMWCPISSHCLWLILCWIGWSLRSFERCSLGGYL